MLADILLYVSHDGKSPRRQSDSKVAIGVSPEEFRRAVMDALPLVEGLAPPIAGLQDAVLRSVWQAADFAYRVSRMELGDDFCPQFLSLLDACRSALAEVREREAGLAAARASCGLPPAMSVVGRPSTSATATLALLARDIHQEACQAALDVYSKATKKSPTAVPDGPCKWKLEVDPPPAAFDKEIARRFNREFVFPKPSLLLTESRLEVMRLDLLEAAVVAVPELPIITFLGNKNYRIGDGKAICVSDAEDYILQCFIGTPAIASRELSTRSGYNAAPRILANLRKKYDLYFASAISCPAKKANGGYRVNVVKA